MGHLKFQPKNLCFTTKITVSHGSFTDLLQLLVSAISSFICYCSFHYQTNFLEFQETALSTIRLTTHHHHDFEVSKVHFNSKVY